MSLDENISLVVQAIGSELKNAYSAINANTQNIANLATAQGQFGKNTTLTLTASEQNLDFTVSIPTTNASILTIDDTNNRVSLLVNTSYNFRTDMVFNVNTNSPRIVTIRGKRFSDDALVYSRTVSIDQSNGTVKSVSTNTLLTLGQNGVPSSPFEMYFTIQCTDTGIELKEFNSVLASGSIGATGVGVLTASGVVDTSKHTTFINVSADAILTLPSAVTNTSVSTNIKRIDTTRKVVSLVTILGQTIDGNSSININPYQNINVVSDGTNWFIL